MATDFGERNKDERIGVSNDGENGSGHRYSGDAATTIYRVDSHCNQLCQALLQHTSCEHLLCDVTLKLNNNTKEFKAHGAVLAACSTFFKSIFDKPENHLVKNVVIVLPDYISCTGLEAILHFVYTGDLEISKSNLAAIYQVAHLLQLTSAIALCRKFVETYKLPINMDDGKILLAMGRHRGDGVLVSNVGNDGIQQQQQQHATAAVPPHEKPLPASEQQQCMPEVIKVKNSCILGKEVVPANVTEKSSSQGAAVSTEVLTTSREPQADKTTTDDDEDDTDYEAASDSADVGKSQSDDSEANVRSRVSETSGESNTKMTTRSRSSGRGASQVDTESSLGQDNVALPVRRSLRKHAGQKRKMASSSSPVATSRSTRFKQKDQKCKTTVKDSATKTKADNGTDSIKCNDDEYDEALTEAPAETLLSKIDPSLKFTDPAKYIAELIDKNSDMLNKNTNDNKGGGVQVVTRGKVTYVFPEGSEVSVPENDPNKTPPPPVAPSAAKVNADGLPYERVVDPLTCVECNITFTTPLCREQHADEKHKDQLSSTKQVMFQCLTCPFSTDFLRNMWFHCHWKHSHPLPSTLRQYCCGLCEYRAPAQGNIEVHIRRIHTHERPLMCDVCGQFFKSLDTLRGHRFYRHQDIFPYPCNVCEKRFKRRHKLDVHMRIHMGYKPFSCTECPHAYYTKFNLKDHMRKRHFMELDEAPPH